MPATLTHPRIEEAVGRVLTQYRESPRLLGVLRTHLAQVNEVIEEAEALPDAFDLNDAVGDQLTIIGRRMGFPRPHPAGRLRSFFGFPGQPAIATPVAGWSIGEWRTGPETEAASMDDDLYRRFLLALRYRLERSFRRADLLKAARLLIGGGAHFLFETPGVLRLGTGRFLSGEERVRVHLFSEVLPVAPGVRLEVWEVEKAFGFGEGWGGWDEGHWPYRIW